MSAIDGVSQTFDPEAWDGRTVNVGGGRECSLSLLETTEICQRLTGNEVQIAAVPETRSGDVPVYLSDCARLFGLDELQGWYLGSTAPGPTGDPAAGTETP